MSTECENCGMIDVPIVHDDCCSGCVCARCKRSAFEAGGSMNDMGWCDTCETLMDMTDEEAAAAVTSGAVPPVRAVSP